MSSGEGAVARLQCGREPALRARRRAARAI